MLKKRETKHLTCLLLYIFINIGYSIPVSAHSNLSISYNFPENSICKTSVIDSNSISGRIMDRQNKPLSFATVVLISLKDSSVASTAVTDDLGKYLFSKVSAGKYNIKASLVGYNRSESHEQVLSGNGGLQVPDIILDVSDNTLQEVFISGRKQLIEKKGDRFIMNLDNIANNSGNSIQILKSAPFVNVSPTNDISLQGKKTLILVDGKPVPESSVKEVLQGLPANNISRAELITNPSAKYDSSYGAVINLITKRNLSEGITGNLRAEGSKGEFAGFNLNGSLTYKYKALTLFGTGGFNKDKIYIYNGQTRIFPQDQLIDNSDRFINYKSFPIRLGADLRLGENQNIGFEVNGNVNRWTGDIISTNLFSKINNVTDSTLNTSSIARNRASTLNYNFNYHLVTDSGKNDLSFLSTFTPFTNSLNQDFTAVLLNPDNTVNRVPADFRTQNRYDIDVLTLQLDYVRKFDKEWQLESGVKFQNTKSKTDVLYSSRLGQQFDIVPENSSLNRLNERIFAAYGILQKNWKKHKIQVGLRVENTTAESIDIFRQNYFKVFPTALYQYIINDKDNIQFSFKRTINRAPYTELVPYSIFINQYTVFSGNPNLKPSYDNALGLNYQKGQLTLSLNFIKSTGTFGQFPINDMNNTNVTYYALQNLDKNNDLFLDVFYPVKLTKWWESQNSASIGYRKASGNVQDENFNLSRRYYSIKSNQSITFSKKVQLDVNGYYVSSYSYDLTRFGGYGNIDATLMIKLASEKLQLRIFGKDILKRNDYYSEQNFTRYTSFKNTVYDSQRIGVGLTFLFGKNKISTPDQNLGNDDAVNRLKSN